MKENSKQLKFSYWRESPNIKQKSLKYIQWLTFLPFSHSLGLRTNRNIDRNKSLFTVEIYILDHISLLKYIYIYIIRWRYCNIYTIFKGKKNVRKIPTYSKAIKLVCKNR